MPFDPQNARAKTVDAVVVRCDELYVGGGAAGHRSANARAFLTGKTTVAPSTATIPLDAVTYDDDGAGGTRYDAGTYRYTNGPAALHQLDLTVGVQPATANGPITATIVVGGAPVGRAVHPPTTEDVTLRVSERVNVPAGADVYAVLANASDTVDIAGGTERTSLTIRSLQDAV